MALGIMQPYFFPYIGYWQLLHAVDTFAVYDNIEYTKDSWIRRNRILVNGQDHMFTIPVEKASDYLDIVERRVKNDGGEAKGKLLRQIEAAYKKAPYFDAAYPLVSECVRFDNDNLFRYVFHSLQAVCKYLSIDTRLVVTSDIDMDHSLKGKHRVMATCEALGETRYINAIGGRALYDKAEFAARNIELRFLQTGDVRYRQFSDAFVPSLSIIDVMMFNSPETVSEMLDMYELV